MNKFKLFFFLLIAVSQGLIANDRPAKSRPKIENRMKLVRGCSNWGFFAEFLWTVNFLDYCIAARKTPVIYWNEHFAYYSPNGYNGSTNCWEYYFEPVSHLQYARTDVLHTEHFYNNHFSTIWWYNEYINNMDLLLPEERNSIKSLPFPISLAGCKEYPVGAHLYSREFRRYVKDKILDPFVRIKQNIQNKIDTFYRENMQGHKVIGIHLRGSFISNEVGQVPPASICDEANLHAGENTIFFIATDQIPLLEEAKKRLKGKVVYYNAYRQETTTSPYLPSQWPPEMGEDVLVETKLLSMCDFFIHTISNVSTAVLYFNPELPHTMLYCGG